MDGLSGFGIDLTIIDGALSRKSSASPAVSDAMVLATGAALSSSLSTLVDLTAFCVGMIRLPLAETHPDTARSVTVSSMAPDVEIIRGRGGGFHQDIRHSGAVPQFCTCRRTAESTPAHSVVGCMCQSVGSQRLSSGFGTLVRKTVRQVADTGV